MAIFLVRHAESEANLDESLFSTMGDHTIPLSPEGEQQAAKVGEFMQNYLSMNLPGQPVRLWASTYERTKQTATGMQENAPNVPWETSVRGRQIFGDPRLREREFGYWDGLSDEQIAKEYPREWKHYNKVRQERGKYYARPHGGESAADVCNRLATFKETLWRDIKNGHQHHVVVNHGLTLRCFVNSFLNLSPDDFEEEVNPSNTAVRLLDIDPETGRFGDYGYIYDPQKEIALTEKPAKPRIYAPMA